MTSPLSSQSIALNTVRHLSVSQGAVGRSIERLSSGLRVNSARDDAAGLAIATRMDASVRASNVVSRGLMDGISLTQVAEGGLDRIGAALQRARELAVQAANGALSDGDRQALDVEFQALLAQIDNVADSNQAFGVHLLKGVRQAAGETPRITDVFPGSGSSVSLSSGIKPIAYIPAGATNVQIDINAYGIDDDLQVFTADGRHLVGTPLNDAVWVGQGVTDGAAVKNQVLQTAYGFTAEAAYDASNLLDGSTAFVDGVATPLVQTLGGMTLRYSGDGDHADGTPNDGSVSGANLLERVQIDSVTQPLLVVVVGSGSFGATASWGSMPDVDNPQDKGRVGPIEITLQSEFKGGNELVRIDQLPSDTTTLGLGGTGITTEALARAAVDALDRALDTVGDYRATLGGFTSRFERAVDTLQQAALSTAGARARILDADMAAAAAEQARARILADGGTALLAQANAMPRQTLDALLGGVRLGG